MIVGSMPGVTSLEKQEYYGYKHNRFWRILHEVFAMPITTYEEKKAIILQHHIILWDVIGMCDRQGSLDSNIRHEQVNDIEHMIKKHSTLCAVFCNGRKSYDLYQKHFSKLPIRSVYLPSTSNANRSIREDVLFQTWEKELQILK